MYLKSRLEKKKEKKSWVVGNNYVGLVTKLILAINLVAQQQYFSATKQTLLADNFCFHWFGLTQNKVPCKIIKMEYWCSKSRNSYVQWKWAGLAWWYGVRLVSKGDLGWNLLRLSFLFKSCGLWTLSCVFVPHNYRTLKWPLSLPTSMQKSFWWWQCRDRYIISLSTHLYIPFPPSPRP